MPARCLPLAAKSAAAAHGWRAPLLARLFAGTALAGLAVQADAASPILPTGGQFVAGQGSINAAGGQLTVNQSSARGIVTFKSFSIGAGGAVQVNNGAGATLGRVTGGDLSVILGTLRATGTLYLVNPQGVVIGKSGVVVTGGSFVASSLDIANQAFLAGGTLLFQGSTSAEVKNLGAISASGGDVFLIARSVTNDGTITAAAGTAGLAAGQEVLLKDASDPGQRIFVRIGGGDVVNRGDIAAAEAELAAAGGNVYALAGNRDGMISATGSATRDGHVWLTAGSGATTVSDRISARNADGSGGTVEITGATVSLAAGAVIDASGASNGGTVLIGGDRQGGASPAQNFARDALADAVTTVIAAGAKIIADGGTGGGAGSGGNVVVWSEQQTAFAGAISVAGGAQGGNGGFVEVSSHGVLAFNGSADRLAPKGLAGTLLLDPENLDIVAGPAGGSIGIGLSAGSLSGSGTATSRLTTGDLIQALAGGNVVVQTGSGGSQRGNIDVQTGFAWSTGSSLTLSAFDSITLESGVTIASNGGGNVTLRADNTGVGGVSGAGLARGFGQVRFKAGAGIVLGGATPGNATILYDGYNTATGTFRKTRNYAGNVGGGSLTTFELVNDAAQLQAIGASARALGQNYALGTSFSASGAAIAPIGRGVGSFAGIFDGEGQTIAGFVIGDGAAAASHGLGLFDTIGAAATVRNLTLSGVTVAAAADDDFAIGMLAGTNLGTVSNVSVSGTIALGAGANAVGGLVGVNGAGAVIVASNAGGAIAATGAVTNVGGLVGQNLGQVAQRSAASDSVSVGGGSAAIGGLVGDNGEGATIASSRASGAVTAGSGSGSIAALILGVGGLVGENDGAVAGSRASGRVKVGKGSSFVGGLVGDNSDSGTIASSSASGAVTASGTANIMGGLVGENDGSVTHSAATGRVSAGKNASRIGGLAGANGSGATIATSTASGDVAVGSNAFNVGGLAGQNLGDVRQSLASGTVKAGAGSSDIGGLVGSNAAGRIAASMALGTVFAPGASNVGGLVGENDAAITRSLAAGAVLADGGSDVGGLVGSNGGRVTSSFWDTETTGQSTSAGGTGVTTAELQAAGAGTPFAVLNGGTADFGIVAGQSFPYLSFLFPAGTAPQVVSGTAGWSAAGEGIGLVLDGKNIASGTVGANGYYNLLLAPGTLAPGNALLAYLTPLAGGNAITGNAVRLTAPSAATASVGGASIATTVETGLDIAANAVQVTNDGAGPLASSLLATALGTLSNPGILYGVSAAGIDFVSGTDVRFLAGAGNLVIDDALGLKGTGVATLTSNGTITLDQAIQSQASGDAIVLFAGAVAGTAFINNAGADALSTANGRFLVFTSRVGDVSAGGLTADPLYGHSFAAYAPGSIANAGNRFVYAQSETLTVTPGSSSVVYNGQAQTATPGFSIAGLVAGDSLARAVSGGAGFTGGSGRNAGSYGITATLGTLASDFGYTFAFGTGTFTITPAALTVSAVSDSRSYNGTTSSVLTPRIASGTVFAGDSANFIQAFASKNVLGPNGSTLIASGSVSDGNGGNNYTVTFANAAGTITPAPLTVSAVSDTRIYNGTTSSSLAPLVTSGTVFAGDRGNFTQAFASKNVLGPNGSTLVASGAVGDGNGGNNYAVTFLNAAGTVTPAPLTVSAVSDTRIYNGTTSSSLTPLVTSGAVFAGDSANFTQAFASKNVLGPNGSTLVASGAVGDGNGGTNYAITFVNAAGTITPAPLTVSAASDTRVYNGTTSSAGAPLVTAGTIFAGDSGTFTQAFASKNVLGANGSTLVASGAVSDGNGGRNYAITFVNAAGTITPAPLTIKANDVGRLAGSPTPFFSATFGGFVAGESRANLSGTLGFATPQPTLGTAGIFPILPFGLASPNYQITFLPGVLTVTAPNNTVPPIVFAFPVPVTSLHPVVDPLTLTQLTGLAPAASGAGDGTGSVFTTLLPSFDENGNALGPVLFSDSSFIPQ